MILTGLADPDDARPAAEEQQPRSARWSVPPPALEEAPPRPSSPAPRPSVPAPSVPPSSPDDASRGE